MARSELSLLVLPNEIFPIITKYCSLPDLKRLRLCCARLARASEPQLFETVVLVPHNVSFVRLKALSQQPSLSPLIRSLIYDPRVILHQDHFSAWNAWQKGQVFRVEDHMQRFSSVLRDLSRLECIHIRASDDDRLQPPTFYNQISERNRKTVRLQPVQQEAAAAAIASAIAISGICIRDFRVDGVRWQVLGEGGEPSITTHPSTISNQTLDRILSKTRRLELKFQIVVCRMPNVGDLEAAYSRLGSALTNGKNLDCLRIRFIHHEEWLNAYITTLNSPILLPAYVFGSSSYYPMLRSLSIEAYFTFPAPWLDFLRNVAPTLRLLRLTNIALCRGHQDNTMALESTHLSDTCWVSMLKQMKSILHLDEIDFQGVLASSGGQRWAVTETRVVKLMSTKQAYHKSVNESHSRKPCLKAHVTDWFLNGGPCPLDQFALQPGRVPDDRNSDPGWRGDWSWWLGRLDEESP